METRTVYLDTAAVIRPLLAATAVAERWDRPSALPEMTVGTLAGHLSRAVTMVAAYLDADPPPADAPLLDGPGYFLAIEGLGGQEIDLDSALHRGIRRRSDEAAAGGHHALVARWDATVVELRRRLGDEPAQRTVAAFEGRASTLDQFLVTRLVELVVHSDDLAVSVDAPSPVFDAAATGAAIECLIEVARRSHGDLAVLRALTRRERDTAEALRVL